MAYTYWEMYCGGIDIIRAFCKDPVFSWHYFATSGARVLYEKTRKRQLLLPRYAGKRVLDVRTANEMLKHAIHDGVPYMFGRYGRNELNCVTEYLLTKKGISRRGVSSSLEVSMLWSGLFPRDEETVSGFAELMLESSGQVSLLGTFRSVMEDYYIKYYMDAGAGLTHLYLTNFWLFEKPFTSALKDKNVLVIHPFADTIARQYEKRRFLFDNPEVLPEFNLKTLKAVQTIAGERDPRFPTWFDAFEYMYREAMKIDFDVALIGCGAYGFPLAARIKKASKAAIHTGGVTQMLFGIKGGRWDRIPEAARLYNQHWTRPAPAEIPALFRTVEGGCYW